MRDYFNYHNTSFKEKFFRDSKKKFEQTLAESPEVFSVVVNGVSHDVIIHSTIEPNKRTILFSENAIQHGDIVEHKSLKWLVTDLPINNRVYDKSKMAICNETLTLVEEGTTEIVGYDDMGRPIPQETAGTTHELPCVIESKTDSIYDRNEQINLPEGRLSAQVSYDPSLPIDLTTEFTIFGENYVVYNRDFSNVLNGKGVLRLLVKKTT